MCVTAGTSRQPLASPAELMGPFLSALCICKRSGLAGEVEVGWEVFLSLVVLVSCR